MTTSNSLKPYPPMSSNMASRTTHFLRGFPSLSQPATWKKKQHVIIGKANHERILGQPKKYLLVNVYITLHNYGKIHHAFLMGSHQRFRLGHGFYVANCVHVYQRVSIACWIPGPKNPNHQPHEGPMETASAQYPQGKVNC